MAKKDFFSIAEDATVINSGTIRAGEPDEDARSGVEERSEVRVDGRLLLEGGEVFSRALFDVGESGYIGGYGTLVSGDSIFVNGQLEVDQRGIVVDGSLTMEVSSDLRFNVSESQPGEEPLLQVSQRAALPNSMRVDFIDGFMPEVGERFPLLSFASLSADLDAIDVLLSGGNPEHSYALAVEDDVLFMTLVGDIDGRKIDTVIELTPAGSLIYEASSVGTIGSSEDVDTFVIELDAGQGITLQANPLTGQSLGLRLETSEGQFIAETTALPNFSARLTQWTATEPGEYRITIESGDGSSGQYRMQTLLNAANDPDGPGGRNSTLEGAFSVDDLFVDLPGGGSRAGIVSSTSAGSRVVLYSADMSEDPGWTLDGGWEYGRPEPFFPEPRDPDDPPPVGNPGEDAFLSLDPDSGNTGDNVIGYQVRGNYLLNMPEAEYATTPTIDTTGYRDIELSFYRYLTMGLAFSPENLPAANIQTVLNGEPASTLYRYTPGDRSLLDGLLDTSWLRQTYSLPGADNQESLQVRWSHGPHNAVTTSGGWNIDDVVVTGIPAAIANDFYELTLSDQQTLNLRSSGSSELSIRLYDESNRQLASSRRLPNGDSVLEWIDVTSDGEADTYFVHVTGAARDGFRLVATKDAIFEAETFEDNFVNATPVIPTRTILGHLSESGSGSYQIDDGVSERTTQLREGGDLMWMNALEASPEGNIVDSISVAFATWVDEGRPIKVLLYEDPNDDGEPVDAILLTTADTVVSDPGTDQFVTVPITPTVVSGKFFVAAFMEDQTLIELGPAMDNTDPMFASWFIGQQEQSGGFLGGGDEEFNFEDLLDNSIPPVISRGNYLLRANYLPVEEGEDWYLLAANAGDSLTIAVDSPGQFPGVDDTLVPRLELHDAGGQVVAEAVAGMGEPASINYDVAEAGSWRVRVSGVDGSTGSYVLQIGGATAEQRSPEVIDSNVADVESSLPGEIVLTFSDPIAASSVAATDLTINGLSAASARRRNTTQVAFTLNRETLPPTDSYEVVLSAGALRSTLGAENLEFRQTFVVDSVAPRVAAMLPAAGVTIPTGDTELVIEFAEPIELLTAPEEAVELVGQLSGEFAFESVSLNDAGTHLTVFYSQLPDDTFSLRLNSNAFVDAAGNSLVGDLGFSFVSDSPSRLVSLEPIKPLGSLAYESMERGTLGPTDRSDVFKLPLHAGQSFVAISDSELNLTMEFRNAAGDVVATSEGNTLATTASDETRELVMTSDADTYGSYSVRVLLGLSLEQEAFGDSTNNAAENAEDLSASTIAVGAAGSRMVVAGSLAEEDSDWYRVTLVPQQTLTAAVDSPDTDFIELELYSPEEALLATGRFVGNSDRAITNFANETETTKDFLIRLSGPAANYTLLATVDVTFDIEGNNRLRHAQDITETGAAFGHIMLPRGTVATPTSLTASSPATAKIVAEPPPALAEVPSDIGYTSGRLLVKFEEMLTDSERNEFLSAHNSSVLKTFRSSGWSLVELDTRLDPAVEAERWMALPAVARAEPNYELTYQPDSLPNDELLSRLFGFLNTGQIGGTAGADINIEPAWEITTGSRQVVLASIDTGVNYNHPDLAANMWRNPGEIPDDGIDNDGNGYVDDIHGIGTVFPQLGETDPFEDALDSHGSHTIGTLGAVGNNQLGVAGVNWEVQVMAMRAGTSRVGLPLESLIESLEYMTMMKRDYGVNVVASNNSYGGRQFSQSFRDAIEASIDAGILFVASAGNNARNTDEIPAYPASYDLDGIIAVAATDKNDDTDSVSGFTNLGPKSVDLGAPGLTILSTVGDDDYRFFNGTSMAAPMVTGTAGLLSAIDPLASVTELKDAILSGVDPLEALDGKTVTGGKLNVANSVAILADDYYRIEAKVGETLKISTRRPMQALATGEVLDIGVELFDPDGIVVAQRDASSGTSTELSHIIESAGIYVVRIFGASAGTRGEYLLEVTRENRLVGDFDQNGVVDARDIDLLSAAIRDGENATHFDLTNDDRVDIADKDFILNDVLDTMYGDADLNGIVEFADFLILSQNFGQHDKGWADGDFDGDKLISFADFLLLSQNFENRGAVAKAS